MATNDVVVRLRCSAEDRVRWILAAENESLSLSEWIRRQLDGVRPAVVGSLPRTVARTGSPPVGFSVTVDPVGRREVRTDFKGGQ